jgi:hypothetical protein
VLELAATLGIALVAVVVGVRLVDGASGSSPHSRCSCSRGLYLPSDLPLVVPHPAPTERWRAMLDLSRSTRSAVGCAGSGSGAHVPIVFEQRRSIPIAWR